MDQYENEQVNKIDVNVWKKVFKILGSLKKQIIVLILFAVMLALTEALNSVMQVYAIETFVEDGNYKTLPYFIAINVLFVGLMAFLIWGFVRNGTKVEATVTYTIRKEAFENLQKLSYSYFDKTPQGWIMARMTSDSKRLANIISWAILDFFWASLYMIFTLSILYFYNVRLALIVTASLPFMVLVVMIFRKRMLRAHRKSRKYNSIATAKYSEAFLGAKTTKTLVIERPNLEEFDEVTNNLKRSTVRAISISAMFSSVLLTITYLTLAIVMFEGSDLVIASQVITIPVLTLFLRSTVNFFEPVMQLTNIMSNVQQAQASAERIVGLIETKPDIVDSEEVIEKYGTQLNPLKDNYQTIKGNVEFKNVDFYYTEDEQVLKDFNLKINAGSKVALVGSTGSGKTTIVNLLSRFYEPVNGQILIDGTDYKEASINWLHSQIGYVLQTPHLFSTTILENIRYGKLDANLDDVIRVSKLVGLDDFVNTLTDGYNTHVGEGGNLLSTGQKQLISFARALINDPKILVLDEATSAIDSESEQLIEKATKTILENRTSFVVAHRLSTIKDSNIIILLDHGVIKEMGTHNELINLKGAYYDLYKSQFIAEKMAKHML